MSDVYDFLVSHLEQRERRNVHNFARVHRRHVALRNRENKRERKQKNAKERGRMEKRMRDETRVSRGNTTAASLSQLLRLTAAPPAPPPPMACRRLFMLAFQMEKGKNREKGATTEEREKQTGNSRARRTVLPKWRSTSPITITIYPLLSRWIPSHASRCRPRGTAPHTHSTRHSCSRA